MSEKSTNLTLKSIFIFWLPLSLTWLMMSLEGPFIAAVIARLIEPKFNLAAYGVAFSFALIAESPIIMIMSASTKLVKSNNTYKKLKNFTFTLNGIITLIMLTGLLPPVFDFITLNLIGLPKEVAILTYKASFVLLPWPAAIGFRRFYQGILISSNKTKFVALGTAVRLISMATTALILYHLHITTGAVTGALSLSVGVSLEAIATYLMSVNSIKNLISSNNTESISYLQIVKFYYPLAITSILALGVHPIVTFFLSKSRLPVESLAVLPVVNSLVFIFRSMGLSYQEVGIALIGNNFENLKKLKQFALILGISSSLALSIIAFSPLSKLWFHNISGLSELLTSIAITPTKIMVLFPALSVLISWQRSILVSSKNTKPITMASVLEISGIVFGLFITIKYFNLIGVTAAAISFLTGRTFANLYLHKHYSKIVNVKKQ
jgi:O-antigen/teichoic acid export membrane protein